MITATEAPDRARIEAGALLLRLGRGVSDGAFALLRSGRPAGARVAAAAA